MTIEEERRRRKAAGNPVARACVGSNLPSPGRINMVDSTEVLDYRRYPVLYIDDEAENLEAFQDEFEEYFTIHTAATGAEGLGLLAREPIALLLADQRMPVMSGVEVLEQAQRIDPRILRILITAYADIEVVIDSINKGIAKVFEQFPPV